MCLDNSSNTHLCIPVREWRTGHKGNRVSDFLLGDSWKPNQDLYGVFPMIIGSIYVTAGAIIVGVPIGLLCAVFMARYCLRDLQVMKPAVDLLAGIPSIVYGFFGLDGDRTAGAGITGRKRKMSADVIGPSGDHDPADDNKCIRIEHRAVPEYYYEGALALGATRRRSIFRVMSSGCQDGYHGRDHPGDRKSDRRDHGSGNGLREPGDHAGRS